MDLFREPQRDTYFQPEQDQRISRRRLPVERQSVECHAPGDPEDQHYGDQRGISDQFGLHDYECARRMVADELQLSRRLYLGPLHAYVEIRRRTAQGRWRERL